jgi:hypothetical protein
LGAHLHSVSRASTPGNHERHRGRGVPFLLAITRHAATSTHKQALSALLFLIDRVTTHLGWPPEDVEAAKLEAAADPGAARRSFEALAEKAGLSVVAERG